MCKQIGDWAGSESLSTVKHAAEVVQIAMISYESCESFGRPNVPGDVHNSSNESHDQAKVAWCVSSPTDPLRIRSPAGLFFSTSPPSAKPQCRLSFLSFAAGCRDFAGCHEIPNILLQKFIVIVELVVLFLDSFNAVKEADERVLECLGVPL